MLLKCHVRSNGHVRTSHFRANSAASVELHVWLDDSLDAAVSQLRLKDARTLRAHAPKLSLARLSFDGGSGSWRLELLGVADTPATTRSLRQLGFRPGDALDVAVLH
jgi:hypothetical protein